MLKTIDDQLEALGQLVEDWAIQTAQNVRGEFTGGDFVEWKLSQIFGPHNWDLELLWGPEIEEVSSSLAYSKVMCRLHVRFADGTATFRDAPGAWPLVATKAGQGGTLEETSPERYETVLKAAVTDALKGAAERLGTCFRPLHPASALKYHLWHEQRVNGQSGSAEKAKADLVGTSAQPQPRPKLVKKAKPEGEAETGEVEERKRLVARTKELLGELGMSGTSEIKALFKEVTGNDLDQTPALLDLEKFQSHLEAKVRGNGQMTQEEARDRFYALAPEAREWGVLSDNEYNRIVGTAGSVDFVKEVRRLEEAIAHAEAHRAGRRDKCLN